MELIKDCCGSALAVHESFLHIGEPQSCFKCIGIYSRSCLLNPPLPPAVCTGSRRDGSCRGCLSSSLGEVHDKPLLAFQGANELLLRPAPNPTRCGASWELLNKAHPELLVGNKYFSEERIL